jgi:RNA-directed DNA polymerase
LHPDKTRLFEFGRFASDRRRRRGQQQPETFDFLGFTHCCGTDRQGRFQVIRVTSKKRMRTTLTAIRETLYRRRHEPVPVIGAWIRRVLSGYFEYLAVSRNLKRWEGFRAEVCRAWRHALLRRSQRHRLSWERFNRLTRKYVHHAGFDIPYPEERFLTSRPQARAVCGNSARTDLCRGRSAMAVPTATHTRVSAANYNWQVTQPGIIKLRTLSGQAPLAPVMSSG